MKKPPRKAAERRETMGRKQVPRLPTSWDDVPVIMDLVYAARIVGVTPERLRAFSQPNYCGVRFPAGKVGGHWRVSKEALMEYLMDQGILHREAAS